MKTLKYIIPLVFIFFSVSCEKNEIEYNATPVGDNTAEFQLHYFVPVVVNDSNNITKVELNDKLFSNTAAPLKTYNAIPTGVGRFYTIAVGTHKIKMYQGETGDNLVYEQQVSLTKGKQNIFVYDLKKPPIVFNNEFPYTGNITQDTDSTCWVKFYNFLYESTDTETALKLQYQYIDTKTKKTVNIGQPIAFGGTTGWQPVKVIKAKFNSAGSNTIDFTAKVVDDKGNIVGDLTVINSENQYIPYKTSIKDVSIGRRYHHILGGMRTLSPFASIQTFTAF